MSAVAPERHLGRGGLAAIGINSVVGGGIFVLPATVAALIGSAALAAYVVAGAVVLGVGAALARLASRCDASGGPYLYVRRSFGPFAGFQVGWLFCLARITAMANLLHAFALYLGALIPGLARPMPQALLVLGCTVIVVAVNIAGIRQTSMATNLAVLAKLVPLAILGLAGLFYIRAENFAPAPVPPVDFLRAVLLLIFAFSGFEILAVPAEEAMRPRTDVPAALFTTILLVGGLYLLVHTVAMGTLPTLGNETAPLASVAGILVGRGGQVGMTAVAALSIAACGLASLFGATRLLYAMASSREIPAWIGALSPNLRTPAVASILVGGVAATLAVLGGYAFLAAVSAGTRLLTYLACTSACVLRSAGGNAGSRITAAVTSIAIVALLFGLERREVLFGMIGVIIGLILYLVARRERGDRVTDREAV